MSPDGIGFDEREGKEEAASGPLAACHTHIAPHEFDESFGDRQPKASATHLLGQIRLFKGIKYGIDSVRSYTNAGVADFEVEGVIDNGNVDINVAYRSEFNCVANEIGENLA